MSVILYFVVGLFVLLTPMSGLVEARTAGFLGIILFNIVLWLNRTQKLPQIINGPRDCFSDWRVEMITGIFLIAVCAWAIFWGGL